MAKVFILMCSAGDYDEVVEFPLVVYSNEAIAKSHAIVSNEYVEDYRRRVKGIDFRKHRLKYECPHDHRSNEYESQHYYVEEVEFYI